MIVDFRDPESLATWLEIWPARHWDQLGGMCAVHPQWAEPARQAREIVKRRQAAKAGARVAADAPKSFPQCA